MTPHARRIVKTIAASLFVLLLAGVTYQGVATALERRAFKYPGRLVPVGDHQLHLYCIGTGAPVVVLEAPALGFSASWSTVQAAVAADTRVCAYDRAGLGWSEASEGRFRSTVVPEELQTLLQNAGERGPFVLVGDGLGAAYITQFAVRFPEATRALVLVDFPAEAPAGEPTRAPSPWLARTGILRLSQSLSRRAPDVPGPAGGAVRAFSLRPDHLTRSSQEMRQSGSVMADARSITLPPALPVRRIESPDGGAMLRTPERSEALVQTIRDLVREVREGTEGTESTGGTEQRRTAAQMP